MNTLSNDSFFNLEIETETDLGIQTNNNISVTDDGIMEECIIENNCITRICNKKTIYMFTVLLLFLSVGFIIYDKREEILNFLSFLFLI